MTEEKLRKGTGEATKHVLDNILDSEYYIINDNEEVTGNFLLDSPDFKSFAAGLTELLISKGYTGDTDDNKAKYKYLNSKCKENNISLTPSVVKSWFENTRPISSAKSRENMYRLCFALNCTLEETIDFFTRVYFECPFNFRSYQESIYYFCFKNSLSYDTACTICVEAAEIFDNAEVITSEALFTHTRKIGNAIDTIETSDELLKYIAAHKNDFLAANRTAYDFAEKLIKENTKLALDIFKSEKVAEGYDSRKIKHEQNIDIFLLVLFDFDMHAENKEKSFSKESNFPELISSNFISKENLSRILNHEKVSYDSMRKCLMILEFFNYFAKLKLEMENNGEVFCCFEEDFEIFLDEIGNMLDQCGYPPLYPRNPFDWFIMHCANTADEPLKEFRNAIQVYYLNA